MQRSFMTKPLEYTKDNDTIRHYVDENIIVIEANSETVDRMPIFCDVCKEAMSSVNDELYYSIFSCCSECGMKWAESNQDKWCTGWRPEKRDIENELENRRNRSKPFLL